MEERLKIELKFLDNGTVTPLIAVTVHNLRTGRVHRACDYVAEDAVAEALDAAQREPRWRWARRRYAGWPGFTQ